MIQICHRTMILIPRMFIAVWSEWEWHTVRKAQYFRNKNLLLENRSGTALHQVPDWSAAHVTVGLSIAIKKNETIEKTIITLGNASRGLWFSHITLSIHHISLLHHEFPLFGVGQMIMCGPLIVNLDPTHRWTRRSRSRTDRAGFGLQLSYNLAKQIF